MFEIHFITVGQDLIERPLFIRKNWNFERQKNSALPLGAGIEEWRTKLSLAQLGGMMVVHIPQNEGTTKS